MCSRYSIGERVYAWLRRYGWNQPVVAGDVCPQETTPALAIRDRGFTVIPMKWGMRNPQTRSLVINARQETAAQKPMFSRSLKRCRCVLPAEQFYEWDARRQKTTFRSVDHSLLFLCGLYRAETDGTNAFVILTKEANDVMRPVHDRMPVMIREEKIRDWLTDESLARDLLTSEVTLTCSRPLEQMSLFR